MCWYKQVRTLVDTCTYASGYKKHQIATRAQSLSKMMRKCENEMFTFEFDSEAALVVSTLER